MAPEPDLFFPPFRLDREHHSLWRGTDRVPLRPKAFAVLQYLAAQAPHLVTPADLLRAVWAEAYVSEGLLRSYMRELRAVLGDTAKTPQFIETVVRRGWRFLVPVLTAPPVVAVRALATAPGPVQPPAPLLTASASMPVTPPMPSLRRLMPGEPKQVTVLVAGLHGVPALAQVVETEGLYEILSRAATLMREQVERFVGTVAQCSGDRLVALFGAPIAQEDHVARALQAALEIQRAVAVYANELRHTRALTLALAVGVHTGPVVLGPHHSDAPPDPTAYGVTVSLAERVQGLAAGGAIAVSAAVWQQAMAMFHFEDLGRWTLPDMAQPVQVYVCTGVAQGASRLEAFLHRHRSPFVGRAHELEFLGTLWRCVSRGQGQVVVLFGDAGVGKSRLADAFQRTLPAGRTLHAHTLSYGQAMPYHALLPLLRTAVGLADGDPPQQQRQTLQACLAAAQPPLTADEPLLAHLLGVPLEPDHLPPLPPEEQQRRLQHACLQVVLQHAAAQPLCLLIEDLHWLDPSSQALLDLLVTAVAGQPVLVLGTARPGFRDPWTDHTYYHRLTVAPLSDALTATFAHQYCQPYAVAPTLTALLYARTAGNPFFLEEMLRTLQDQGLMVLQDHLYVVTQEVERIIPTSIQGILAARIDQLAADAKHLLQTAAVLGREVPWALLTRLAELSDQALDGGLSDLQSAELLYETRVLPVRTYTFKHALTQEVAYQSLLASTRRQVHQRLAQLLEAEFPETVATQPELVAQHYTAAGCAAQAVRYWLRAGQHASERSATVEAISHLTTGLALLQSLPATPEHTQHALALYLALGAALQMAHGIAAPEVEHAYTQARALCQQVGETPQLAPVLFGLWRFSLARAQLHTARALGDALLRLTPRADDPALAVVAHFTLGVTCFYLGALPTARQHLEDGIARCTPDHSRTPVFRIGHDPGVACRADAALTLWLLGYPQQALARLHEALALAHALAHPYSLAFARCWAATVYQVRRDVLAVQAQAEAVVALAVEQGFPFWAAQGASVRGWALAMQGQSEAGVALVRQGLAAFRATGAVLWVPYLCTLLADACDPMGDMADGRQALTEAYTLVEEHDERWWEAEIARMQGVLLLRQPGASQAEAEGWLQRALDVARRQEAKSLELRAAMSLSRLWQQRGQRTEARELLAPIYGWFTEGFDTADLQEGKALLEALA
ncbi:MAG: AAA family ATPase [Candidatus Tectimicrobiota bacterium]